MSQTVPADRRPYPHPTRSGVYFVPLTHGRLALIDACDVRQVAVSLWGWAPWAGTNGYARHFTRLDRKRVSVTLARFIAGMGTDDRRHVNHKNDDTLDCRRENLRIGDEVDVKRRARKRRLASSQYKGVSWNRVHERWQSRIKLADRVLHLGWFREERRAAEMYDEAAATHFGEFARLNFPDEQRTHHGGQHGSSSIDTATAAV